MIRYLERENKMGKKNVLVNMDMSEFYDELSDLLIENDKIHCFKQILLLEEVAKHEPIFVAKANECINIIAVNREDIVYDVYEELTNPSAPIYMDYPVLYNEMSGEQLYKWFNIARRISDLLKLKKCPQIIFSNMDDGIGGYSSDMNMIFAPNYPDEEVCRNKDFEEFVFLAHELRHAWQYENHPEWSEDYITPEQGVEEYTLRKAEVDAEVFAQRIAFELFGMKYNIEDSVVKTVYENYDLDKVLEEDDNFERCMTVLGYCLEDDED